MSVDDADTSREALTKFLRGQAPVDGIPPGSLLTGWAIVVSWVDPDGHHRLARAHAAEINSWMASGMHHEALYGDWPVPDE